MKVDLLYYTKDPINAIETAASTCYDSVPTDGNIMKHCYKSGHHSVLEFADFTFRIEGVSRALSHQLVRHRIASYAQRSQRYCKEDGFTYTIPDSIKKNEEVLKVYETYMKETQETYDKLLSCNIPAEDARMVLTNSCHTTICVKMNLRSLIHFCNERLCNCAQKEIREMALLMKNEVLKIEPRLNKMLVPKCEIHSPYCFCTESSSRSCGRAPLLSDIFLDAQKWRCTIESMNETTTNYILSNKDNNNV